MQRAWAATPRRLPPGGRQIAFERAVGPIVDNNAARVDIVTMHADGTHLRQLTQT